MGKDRSKKLAVKWATHHYCDVSSRGHVTVGVRGTPIRVTVEMNAETKTLSQRTETYARTCEADSVWGREMARIIHEAEVLARHEWDVWRDTGKTSNELR